MNKSIPSMRYPSDQFTDVDREVLGSLLKDEHKIIYEIGSWLGNSTSVLAEHAKKVGGHVWTIDTFDGRGSYLTEHVKDNDIYKQLIENLKQVNLLDYVTICYGSSTVFLRSVEDERIDFMFIDGDHRYTQFKQDIDGWYPKMRIGGIFAGHDYDSNCVLDEAFIEEDYHNGHQGILKALPEKFSKDKIRIHPSLSTIWSIVRE